MEPGLSNEWQDLRGRARADEEANTVRYRVFLLPSPHDAPHLHEPLQILDAYLELLDDIRSFVHEATEGYIWQVDGFHLSLECLPTSGQLCLAGNATFGENVEDEWLIVWLLQQISTQWTTLACSVVDNDGEFLLIEAAQALPSWVDGPHSTAHRVYICQAHLCLIPPEVMPHEDASLPNALNALANDLGACKCGQPLQDSVWKRSVNEQPGRAMELNTYIARCVLHERCAKVLQVAPWMIAPIVRAYLYRDEQDVKQLKKMSCMDLKSESEDSVFVQRKVRFTRCTYAQVTFSSLTTTSLVRDAVKGQRKGADAFAESMSTVLKVLEEGDGDEESIAAIGLNKEERAVLLGWKLWMGLELLLSSDKWTKDRTPAQVKESTMKRAMVAARELSEHRNVVERYLSFCLLHPRARLDGSPTLSLAEEAREIWRRVSAEECPLEEDGVEMMEEPDDGWMKVDASQVDRLVANAKGDQLEEVFNDVNSFLQTEAGQEESSGEERIGFDVDKFMAIFEAASGGLDADAAAKDEQHSNDKRESEKELGFFETVELMDKELEQQQAIGSAVTRIEPTTDHPLDINFTVVNNLIESLESQEGNPGPVSNLLGELAERDSSSGD